MGGANLIQSAEWVAAGVVVGIGWGGVVWWGIVIERGVLLCQVPGVC